MTADRLLKFRKNLRERLHVYAGVLVYSKMIVTIWVKRMPVRAALDEIANFGPASAEAIMPRISLRVGLEHEKCEAVVRKDHAQTKS